MRPAASWPSRQAPSYHRDVLVVSLALGVLALLLRWVSPREVPGLLDLRLLGLFFVLILAVECAEKSRLFEHLVHSILSRVRSARALAVAAILVTGATSAIVTNDVALLLVVPFTLAFHEEAPDLELPPLVILEIHAANLLGCLTPTGNPQNLFLYTFGRFTPARFALAQAPWVLGMLLALLLVVPLLVKRRPLPPPGPREIAVEPVLAAASIGLLTIELLTIFKILPPAWPLLATVPAFVLLGRDFWKTDFSLVAVFAALFVGVEGLHRSPIAQWLDPVRLFGGTSTGFVLSGAVLSQVVSNVPAALLLASGAAARGDGRLFTALLYGVNAGGCGTPIASVANIIGARLYLAHHTADARWFWWLFSAVSFGLLAVATLLSLALIRFLA